MKGLYIYYDLTKQNYEGVGILKKVYAQHKLFNAMTDCGCDLLNLPLNIKNNRVFRFFSYLFSKKTFNITSIIDKYYDYVYIRQIFPNCKSSIDLLRILKMSNPRCKILYEIPTYPYDFTYKSFIMKLVLFIDSLYRKKLYLYVDRIVTLSDDKEIFGCSTLKITNGVDCDSIPICKKKYFDNKRINLIAVAQFGFWDGYERLIEGLYNYKGNNIFLHFVGSGAELEKYKNLVREFSLESQVIFHGILSGTALTDVFDVSDIALCPLAAHRIHIFSSSALKSREYLCRGLPMVTSTCIDIIPNTYKYCLKVSEDDSPVDMQCILDFANSIYGNGKNRLNIISEIRTFAEQTCDMNSAMTNVIDFIKGEKNV